MEPGGAAEHGGVAVCGTSLQKAAGLPCEYIHYVDYIHTALYNSHRVYRLYK